MQMFSTSSSRFSFLLRKVWKSGGAISDLVGIICPLDWSIYQNLKGPVGPPPQVPTPLSSSRFSFLPRSFSTYSQNGGSLEGRRHTFDVSGLLNALNTTTKSIFFSFSPYNQSTLSVFFNFPVESLNSGSAFGLISIPLTTTPFIHWHKTPCVSRVMKYPKKCLGAFDNDFHVYLISVDCKKMQKKNHDGFLR